MSDADGHPTLGEDLNLTISGASVGPYDVTSGAKHFWAGVAVEEIRLRRCPSCGSFSHPRQEACQICYAGDLEWEAVGGQGEIYTYSEVHRPPAGGPTEPYAIGFVRLDEGVFLFTRFDRLDRTRIGARVAPCFTDTKAGKLLEYTVVEDGQG